MASSATVGAAATAITLGTNPATGAADYQLEIKIIYSANVPQGFIYLGIITSTGGTNYGNAGAYAGSDLAVTLPVAPIPPFGGGLGNFQPGPNGSLYFPATQIFLAEAHLTSGYATTPTIYLQIPSIANVLGSPQVLPQKWAPFVLNATYAAFAAACTATYTPLTYTNT
jgi:hypothetical protein